MRKVTVLKPGTPATGWCGVCRMRECGRHVLYQVTAADYMLVGREHTIGQDTMLNLIEPVQLAALKRFTNDMEARPVRRRVQYVASSARRQRSVESV